MSEKSLLEVDLARLCDRQFFPSPVAWEDQVLYFLMLDRFSDGNEQGYRGNNGRRTRRGTTPQFRPTDADNALQTPAEADRWRDAGARWVGGTLKGLTSKIGYLQRLGATAIWLSPIFKQVAFHDTYHGYGIHNFLEVDPHFGTRADLVQMVETAHRAGIYVILDIILNHAGDVFGYAPDRYPTADGTMDAALGRASIRWREVSTMPRARRACLLRQSICSSSPLRGPMAPSGPWSFRTRRSLRSKATLAIGITTRSFSRGIFLISKISTWGMALLIRITRRARCWLSVRSTNSGWLWPTSMVSGSIR